jgi:cell shape-determining protein MreC
MVQPLQNQMNRISKMIQPLQKQVKSMEKQADLIKQIQSQLIRLQKQVSQVQKDNQKIRPLLLSNRKKGTSPANNKNTKRRGTRRTK